MDYACCFLASVIRYNSDNRCPFLYSGNLAVFIYSGSVGIRTVPGYTLITCILRVYMLLKLILIALLKGNLPGI